MQSDPIADMLTRIRNATRAKRESVRMPASKLKIALVKLLREEGYVKYFKVVRAGSVKRTPRTGSAKDSKPLSQNLLIVYLKYGPDGDPVINRIDRVSKPGRRKYVQATNIPRTLSGLGVTILSTSQGVMTDREARRNNIGGELICSVW